jgi:putative transposase
MSNIPDGAHIAGARKTATAWWTVRKCRSAGRGCAHPTGANNAWSYELFQRSGPMQAEVWDKMMRGLSTRNYGAVVKDFHDAYGVEKSAVSENFIEASREKVKELMERPLGELRLCAVLIDGTPFRDRQMIVALGIGCDGSKTVLGIREGATENAAVVNGLLSELVERGVDFSTPRLYILDGGKALHAAVRRHVGEAAFYPALPGAQETQRGGPPSRGI